MDQIAAAIARHGLREEARFARGDVSLMAPISHPRRIIGIAHNYLDAIRERGIETPVEPVVFIKNPDTVIGPDAPVVLPEGIGGVTYEAELAVVIGKAGRDIGVADALSYVVAGGVFNDISASELIRRDGSFVRGKNLPTFGPFGPFIATVDEIGNLQQLAVQFEMNGSLLQDSNTAEMLFGVAELVAILSRKYRLEVGDVIATGTPAGVAPARTPRRYDRGCAVPRLPFRARSSMTPSTTTANAPARTPPTWIHPGALMCASVEGLGRLCNPVIKGAAFNG
ncbi:MAG: fumarylacetoacetate hydrolase family protein [Burkholderiales bacterium]